MCFMYPPEPNHVAKIVVFFSDHKSLRTTNLIRVLWYAFWDMRRLRKSNTVTSHVRSHTRGA